MGRAVALNVELEVLCQRILSLAFLSLYTHLTRSSACGPASTAGIQKLEELPAVSVVAWAQQLEMNDRHKILIVNYLSYTQGASAAPGILAGGPGGVPWG